MGNRAYLYEPFAEALMLRKQIRGSYRKVQEYTNCIPRGPWRTAFIAIVGLTLALVGVAMLVLPGPGVLIIAVALAVLSVEFAWAGSIVRQLRYGAVVVQKKWRRRRRPRQPS
jgi:Flp pilus assembly protein TadB